MSMIMAEWSEKKNKTKKKFVVCTSVHDRCCFVCCDDAHTAYCVKHIKSEKM